MIRRCARHWRVPGVAALAVAASAGCDAHRTAAGAGRTVVIATSADADNLLPPLQTTSLDRAVVEQIFDPLAEIGDSLNTIGDRGFVPRLARGWTWGADSLSIAFHLDPRARWHDGAPVTARDVAFTYALYTAPALASPVAPLLTGIDSVSTPDAHTAVFWFHRRSPEQFYLAATEMLVLPAHLLAGIPPRALAASSFARHPVGSGRFRFARWDAGSRIVLVSDSANYRGRARLDRVVWSIAPDLPAAATRLLTGAADFFEAMQPATVRQAARIPSIRVLSYPGVRYGYALFDLRDPTDTTRPHPLFAVRALRRALSMAIDREAIVRNVFDSLAAVSPGPMARVMPTSDPAVRQLPYDPAAAARILDSLGWRDHDGDGIRDRAGHPLAFTITVPASSRDRERLAVLMQGEWRRVGVRADVRSLEIPAYVRLLGTHGFDVAMQLWAADVSPAGLRQNFGAPGPGTGSGGTANYGAYASARFDAELDSALAATSLQRARPRFARAYQTIVDDAPAIWLYEPLVTVGVARRVHLAPLRADAWWAHLADWSVAAAAVPAGSTTR